MDSTLKNRLFGFLNKYSRHPYAIALAGLAVYIFLFFFPPPVTFTRPFAEFHLGLTILIIIFFGLVFSRRGLLWEPLSLTLVLILFAIPLIYKWQSAYYDGQLVGGYFPLSDAQSYYTDAQLLMTGSHVSAASTRRPLFSGFLALILSITGNNLQISEGIIVALTAISIYLAAREIQSVSNPFSAAVYLLICYWFYFPFAGTLMTESLGLSLGSLALTFLLKGTRGDLNLKYFGYGLFALTIALNARQGPFFILPTLIVWIGLLFYKIGRTKSVLLSLTLIVACGMTANIVLSKVIGSPGTTPFSIYSHFVYSLVTGGKGWPQAAIDHPGISEDEIFSLSIDIFKKEPGLLFKGILKSYRDYFGPVDGAFSFMRLVQDRKNTADRILWGSFALGLLAAIINPQQKKYGLILAGFAGILLSVAFLPPSDADHMRIYAATLPFSFYTAATGLAVPALYVGKILVSAKPEQQTWISTGILQPMTMGILLTCLFSPLVLMAIGRPPKLEIPPACPSDQEEIYFHAGNRSGIRLVQDAEITESYLPNIRISDFTNGIVSGPIYTFYPLLDRELLGLNADQAINMVTFLDPQGTNPGLAQSGYLITTGGILPSGYQAGCGIRPKNGLVGIPWFYYAKEIQLQTKVSFLQHGLIPLGFIRILYGVAMLFVAVSVVIDDAALRSMSWKKRLPLFGNLALIVLGILVYLHSNALFPLSWQRTHLEMNNAESIDGHAYQVPLGINWMNQKSISRPPVIIYEDGLPLKHPNEKIYAVKNLGKGRFFVQNGYLYISSSDNSDPTVNGRRYEIEWPTPVRARYRLTLYLLCVIGILIHIRYFTTMIKTNG